MVRELGYIIYLSFSFKWKVLNIKISKCVILKVAEFFLMIIKMCYT